MRYFDTEVRKKIICLELFNAGHRRSLRMKRIGLVLSRGLKADWETLNTIKLLLRCVYVLSLYLRDDLKKTKKTNSEK